LFIEKGITDICGQRFTDNTKGNTKMLNESMTQVVDSMPKEHTVLGFKPENDPAVESANASLNKETSAEVNPLLAEPREGNVELESNNSLQTEPINEQLKEHQATADWDKHDLVEELHKWVERFILEFKLKISSPAIKVAHLPRKCYGHYQPGRNGFGLHNEIAINETYIDSSKFRQVLGTLLHELLHAEQEQTGKPGKHNYHNKVFREKAKSLGLIVDQWGHTQYSPKPSPFLDALDKYSVVVPDIPRPTAKITKPGNSKLKLWICECTPNPVRVRVAIKDFKAKCLECKENFRQSV